MPNIEDINRQYIYSILILYIIADRNASKYLTLKVYMRESIYSA